MGLWHVILWIVLRFFFLFVLAVVAPAISISPARADEVSLLLCEYQQSADPFSLEVCEYAEQTPRKGWKKSYKLYRGENGVTVRTGPYNRHGWGWNIRLKIPLWSLNRNVLDGRP